MTQKKLNVFVSIAPSHIGKFEDIINEGLVTGINILINPGNFNYNPAVWDDILISRTKMGNPSGSIFEDVIFQLLKIRAYKKLIKMCKKIIPSRKYTLYYCNLEDILNNYFFFSFRKSLLQEPVLVEDGIMNYYDYKMEGNRKIIFRIKQLLCKLYNIPYTIVKGQLSGIDMAVVQKQFVSYPSIALYSEKAIALPKRIISYEPEPGLALFIGQDILENIIGSKTYTEKFREIIESMTSILSKGSKVIYKPHRNGSYQTASKLLEASFGEAYQLLHDTTPVELLIERIKPYYIFSFYSTALLNIKMSLTQDNPTQIYSKPLETVDPKILNLFEETGIHVLR